MPLLWMSCVILITTLRKVNADCLRQDPPPDGTVSYLGAAPSAQPVPPHTIALFSCSSHLTLEGSETSVCRPDGSWSNDWPSCVPPQCPDPPPLPHGSIDSDGGKRTAGTKVFYKCDIGYVISGKRFRKCKRTFEWTTLVSCVQNKTLGCDAPRAVHGTKPQRSRDGVKFPIGHVLRHLCRPGYYSSGNPKTTCQGSQQWTDSAFSCHPVSCGHPGRPEHGSIDSLDFRFPALRRFSCDLGYRLAGAPTTICQADQRWSRPLPACRPVKCEGLEAPANGNLDTHENTFQTRVVVSCDEGYTIKGGRPGERTRPLVCGADTRWSAAMPECQEADCGEFGPLHNGEINYPDGTRSLHNAYFSCHKGSDMEGSDVAYCGRTGLWDTNLPTCWRRCRIPEIANGFVHRSRPNNDIYEHNAAVTVSCDRRSSKRFTLIGPEEITCYNGSWSSAPVCKPAACLVGSTRVGDFNVSSGASVDHGGAVVRRCPSGYHLQTDNPLSVCQYGYWDPPRPRRCLPDPCYLPLRPTGTNWYGYYVGGVTLRHDTVVYTSCSAGYEVADREVTNFRCDTGKWTPRVVRCTEAPCTIRLRDHGSFDGHQPNSKVLHDTKMTARCGEGYHPTTQDTTCLLGELSPQPDHCQPDMCTLKISPAGTIYQNTDWFPDTYTEVSKHDHGAEIVIKCEENYALPTLAIPKVACYAGRWSPNIADCQYGLCRLEVAPSGTSYVRRRSWYGGSDKSFSDEADIEDGVEIEVICQDGYSQPPGSSSEVRCRVGKWFPGIVNCEPAACNAPRASGTWYVVPEDEDEVVREADVGQGQAVVVGCAPGYNRHGAVNHTCHLGEWVTQDGTASTELAECRLASVDATQTVYAGENVTMNCASSAPDDSYTISWFRGKLTSSSVARPRRLAIWAYWQEPDGGRPRDSARISTSEYAINITILNVALEDDDVYTCKHMNGNGENFHYVSLSVQYRPSKPASPTARSPSGGLMTSQETSLATNTDGTTSTVPATSETSGKSSSEPGRDEISASKEPMIEKTDSTVTNISVPQLCIRGAVVHGRFNDGIGNTRHGSRELLRCDPGYTASGSGNNFVWVTCDDGRWSLEPLCGTPVEIPATKEPMTEKTDFTVSNKAGTKSMVPATSESSESSSEPDRVRQLCIRGAVVHGRFEDGIGNTRHGSRELVRCDPGYTASGSGNNFVWVKCDDGRWSLEPLCSAPECVTGDVENGYFDANENRFPEDTDILYRCNVGYSTPENEATQTVECVNGQWSPEPVCTADRRMEPWVGGFVHAHPISTKRGGTRSTCQDSCLQNDRCRIASLQYTCDSYGCYRYFCQLYGESDFTPYVNTARDSGMYEVSSKIGRIHQK